MSDRDGNWYLCAEGKFACDKIEIEDGPKVYEFRCLGVLKDKNIYMKLQKEPTFVYEVTVAADEDEKNQSKDPIFISLKGSKGQSEYTVFIIFIFIKF
jgi:hypothetical protein